MVNSDRGADPRPSLSLLNSLNAYVGTWVDLLRVRLDLLSTELAEERERIQQLMIMAVIAVVCLGFGVLLVTMFVVAIFWETEYRLAVLGGLAGFYLCAGAAFALISRRKSRAKPKLFSATLDELAKDYTHLTS